MRELKVTIATKEGEVLEHKTIIVDDDIYELFLMPVQPNSVIVQEGVYFEIGVA